MQSRNLVLQTNASSRTLEMARNAVRSRRCLESRLGIIVNHHTGSRTVVKLKLLRYRLLAVVQSSAIVVFPKREKGVIKVDYDGMFFSRF